MSDGTQSDADTQRNRQLGTALILMSAVVWSMTGMFVRMVPDASVWAVVFWRSVFGGLSVVALAMTERGR